MKSVLQDWITELPIMQQSVLLCAIRGPDGMPKKHPCKPLLRWYRRCVLISAFDKKALLNPFETGGGSFTGPSYKHDDYHDWSTSEEMKEVVDEFLNDRDEYNLHFFMHFVHASEIIGYQHPDSTIAIWWHNLYIRLVHSLHLNIETKQEMEKRLSDNENNWLERSDTAETENYRREKMEKDQSKMAFPIAFFVNQTEVESEDLREFEESLKITILNNIESFKDKFQIETRMDDVAILDIRNDHVKIEYKNPLKENITLDLSLQEIVEWGDSVTLFPK